MPQPEEPATLVQHLSIEDAAPTSSQADAGAAAAGAGTTEQVSEDEEFVLDRDHNEALATLGPPAKFGLTKAGRQLSLETLGKVIGFSRPALFYGSGGAAEAVVGDCKTLLRGYLPPLWLRGGATNLIVATVWRKLYCPHPTFEREIVTLDDGGSISLDWYKKCNNDDSLAKDTPVVLVLHFLTGNSREPQCVFMCAAARREGWRGVSMNYRGCGGTPLTTPKPFNNALTGDVYAAVRHIKAMFPLAPIFLVGFSIGAYTMTNYLGQVDSGVLPADGKVSGAVLIGSGYDYRAETNKIYSSGIISMHYPWTEAVWFHMYVRQHKKVLAQNPKINVKAVLKAKGIAEVEELLIVPAWDYQDLAAYQDDVNGLPWIPKIRTPTLFLSAEDDPFLGKTAPPRPVKECGGNPITVFALTKTGGHIAFLPAGTWWVGRSWMDKVAMEWFTNVIEKGYLNRRSADLSSD